MSYKKLSNIILNIPSYIFQSLEAKDCWALLFIACFALALPVLWAGFTGYIIFKYVHQFQINLILEKENSQRDLVYYLQINSLQQFLLAIEANPQGLYCNYHHRSLISWSHYYKNPKAQEIIIQMMKKYPQNAIAA